MMKTTETSVEKPKKARRDMVAVYVITGATTGIGLATRQSLQQQGHTVFNIDYKDGDYTADLSKPEGRQGTVEAVCSRFPDGIDGLICDAGV